MNHNHIPPDPTPLVEDLNRDWERDRRDAEKWRALRRVEVIDYRQCPQCHSTDCAYPDGMTDGTDDPGLMRFRWYCAYDLTHWIVTFRAIASESVR